MKKFKFYIYGTHFTIITNHNALKTISSKAKLEGRLMQAAKYLMQFDFTIKYRPGKDNPMANYLSRAINMVVEPVHDEMEDQERRTSDRKNWLFVPKNQQEELVRLSHKQRMGHLKHAKLIMFLQQRYYWKGMASDIKQIICKCQTCTQMDPVISYWPLKPISMNYPFQLVSLDTGHIVSPDGKQYYFVLAIDHFTQWVEVQVIPSKTSKNIIRFIRDCLVARYGCPLVIQTNGGKPYVSKQ